MKEKERRRFDRSIEPITESGCWVWTGAMFKSGYGSMYAAGLNQRAHRVSYEIFKGPIGNKTIDHLCGVKCCVNPDHLEAVPHLVNIQRHWKTAKRAMHCWRGHPLNGENLYVNPRTGQRACRECVRAANRKYQKRKRNERQGRSDQ